MPTNNEHIIVPKLQSDEIFGLAGEEKGIIHYLAKYGPDILNNIAEKKTYSTWSNTRHTAKRRLFGSDRFPGLIPHEYVLEIEPKRRLPGRKGNYFGLTTKGMMSALSTNIPLDKIYLYKHFLDFIFEKLNKSVTIKKTKIKRSNMINVDAIFSICENFIKTRIYLFLAWHWSMGFNLQNFVSTQAHFPDFFKTVDENFHEKFPDIDDERKYQFCSKILQDNFTHTHLFKVLDRYTSPYSKKHIKIGDENTRNFIIDKLVPIKKFIVNWPYWMEKLQLIGKNYLEPYSFSHEDDIVHYPIKPLDFLRPKFSSKPLSMDKLFKKEETALLEIGFDTHSANVLLLDVWEKSPDAPETLNKVGA